VTQHLEQLGVRFHRLGLLQGTLLAAGPARVWDLPGPPDEADVLSQHGGHHILTIEELVSGKTLNVKVPASLGGIAFRTR
jgi:hypothetical protein